MSKAARPRSRSAFRLEEIGELDPPWPKAFALRALLRAFPVIVTEGSLTRAKPALVAALLRYAYLGALRWEAEYRGSFGETAARQDPRIEKEFVRLRREIGERWGGLQPETAWNVPHFIQERGGDKTASSSAVLAQLVKRLDAHDQEANRAEVENDWHWCHPLGSVEPQHLREFLGRALWEAHQTPPARLMKIAAELLTPVRQESAEAGASETLALYLVHMHGPLEWDRIRTVVLVDSPEPLDEVTSSALRQIVATPDGIAKLLAEMTLRDRRHCELPLKPSVALFTEAVTDAGFKSRSRLVAFAAELQKSQRTHAPNALWLAWIQNTHAVALDAIRRELESWLPAAVEVPAEAPKPSPSPRPSVARRPMAKRPAPARKAAPKKAVVKKMK